MFSGDKNDQTSDHKALKINTSEKQGIPLHSVVNVIYNKLFNAFLPHRASEK